jgi:hypothetical protein
MPSFKSYKVLRDVQPLADGYLEREGRFIQVEYAAVAQCQAQP